MARIATAYADNAGRLHASPGEATVSDLAAVLGRIGAEAGITGGLAKLLLEKRAEIEQVFAEHDAMARADNMAIGA